MNDPRRLVGAIALGLAGACAMSGVRASAADIHITPADSIQAAIDGADSGDRIILGPGVYQQSFGIIVTGKELTLEGADRETTILDGWFQAIGFVFTNGAPVTIRSLTFRNGVRIAAADARGGALVCIDTPIVIEDCRFEENRAANQGKAESRLARGGALFVSITNDGLIVRISDCEFESNEANAGIGPSRTGAGGAMAIETTGGAVAVVARCAFKTNRAVGTLSRGGAVALEGSGGGVTFESCVFDGNLLSGNGSSGGAVARLGGASGALFTSCVFTANRAFSGSAVYWDSGSLIALHCTIVNNEPTLHQGGAVSSPDGSVSLVNSIITANTTGANGDLLGAYETVRYCLIGDDTGFTVATPQNNIGNIIGASPGFVASYTDLRLVSGSPCIDSADTQFTAAQLVFTDAAGFPRAVDDPASADVGTFLVFINGTIGAADIGAFEFQVGPAGPCPADITGDGQVTAADLALLLGAWGPCP